MAANSTQSPFLEARSFMAEAVEEAYGESSNVATHQPFLSVYEVEGFAESSDPESEAYVGFLNEMYDEEFDEVLSDLMTEASGLYESRFVGEATVANGNEAAKMLQRHFAPLQQETGAMLRAMENKLGERQLNTLTENEIDEFLEAYSSSQPLVTPSFENFGGWLKKAVGKITKGAVNLAKKGIRSLAKLGLGPILRRLLKLIGPLLKRVLQSAIGKLPPWLQPIAGKLAERLPFMKEMEEDFADEEDENPATFDVGQLQQEFNRQVADMLFAPGEIEQDLEVARAVASAETSMDSRLHDLSSARERFITELGNLKEDEDPTPLVEQFLPALIPVLKLGLKLGGRQRVVNFLAKFVAKLIRKFIGPRYAPALSQAIVDIGLRLMQLETTADDEARAASAAVAATVEETMQRVAALPDYILDDTELLEGFALEAFEQAATANLPPVLPNSVYQQRPDLQEAKNLKGTWLLLPLNGAKRYKKFCRPVKVKITPHNAMAVESFGEMTLGEFLEDQLGVSPGLDVEAEMHLYEAIPGTTLPEIAQLESQTPGLGSRDEQSVSQFHPLTPEAAGMLLNEPGLGREVPIRALRNRRSPQVGQRFYHLSVPGRRPLMTAKPSGQGSVRRPTNVAVTLDFPGNEIRLSLFLSERRAQAIGVKLRQQAHIGTLITAFKEVLDRRLDRVLNGSRRGHVKIVHAALAPQRAQGNALSQLPSFVTDAVTRRLKEWLIKALASFLKQHASQFVAATEDSDDGVTLRFAIQSPPGFTMLRDALKGKMPTLSGLAAFAGSPAVKLTVAAGYQHA